MKKLACAVTVFAALAGAATTAAAGPSLTPHIWGVQISGLKPAALNGTWLIAIKPTEFQIAHANTVVVKGTVKIAGDRVTLRDVSGPLSCRGAQASGTYTWKITGKKLNLRRVQDSCPGRSRVLVGVFTLVQ